MSQTLNRYLTHLFKTEQVDEAKVLWLEMALAENIAIPEPERAGG